MRITKKVRFTNFALLLTILLSLTAVSAFAQETEETVVDEVIAQVNESVITLSQITREMQFAIDTLVSEGKTKEEAKTIVEEKKGQLIANIIQEELITQKGKEVGYDKAVESEINQRFIKQRDENNFKSLDELFAAMETQGVSPDDLRKVWRPQIMREIVYNELVDRALYTSITDKELKTYYDKNSGKFKQQASVSISEIFLAFAGKDVSAVRAKAEELVKRARRGEDFAKLAVESSDRPNVAETRGKAGTFDVADLRPPFDEPLKNMKQGQISDPIKVDEIGLEIIRVDERTAASSESAFNENAVRQAIWQEKIPEARKKFIKELKQDAYIKIRTSYRPIVTPFLDSATDPTENVTAGK